MGGVLYLADVDAVLDPAAEEVRRCTLAAVEGRCRLLATDDTSSLGAGRVIRGRGLVAVPGLVDAHAHWGAAAQERWSATPPTPEEIGGAFAAFLPQERAACLEHGVTTIQSMGDPVDWILAMRAAVAGGMPGPRVYAVGPIFTAPGGHPAGDLFRGNDWLVAQACRQFGPGQGPAAAAEVDALARRGVDAIKVVHDSGRGALPCLDERVLAAITTAAHARGLRVHAHVGTTGEALTVLQHGADVIEHVPDPEGGDDWDRVAAALRARHAAICPTLVVLKALLPTEPMRHMAAWVAHLAATGVAVHAGTDLGNPGVSTGLAVHEELALLQWGGMAPAHALAAATTLPGNLLPGPAAARIGDGAHADWLLVRGDPLRDVGILRRPSLVVLGGRVVAGSEQREWVA